MASSTSVYTNAYFALQNACWGLQLVHDGFSLQQKMRQATPFGEVYLIFLLGLFCNSPSPFFNNSALQFGRNAQRFSSSSASPCFTVPLALAATAA